MRKRLAWLGFGPIGGGTYVSPRDVTADVRSLIGEHGVHAYARVFTAKFGGPGRDEALARTSWDLDAIAARYRRFIAHYEPMYRRDTRRQKRRALPDKDAFVVRFALTHDFRRFPFIDPDLPASLLPARWAGARARDLFERYHDMLTAGAFRFFSAQAGVRSQPLVQPQWARLRGI
jgi:phenylacetic acid degradation operon negative regulatory protein